MNPIIRGSDRLEAWATLAALTATLFAIPVAAHVGAEIHDAGMRAVQTQAHSRHSVSAVSLDDGPGPTAMFDGAGYVRAQWQDGPRLRTERVLSSDMVGTGQRLTIWLDEDGNVVDAPLKPVDAVTNAYVAAASVGVAIAVASALALAVARRLLDRSRDRAWQRELHLMFVDDDGWATR